MLKKEFRKSDVNRARNLIMGKTGASTGTQIGYNKKTEDYKEGDVWTENRKTWTMSLWVKRSEIAKKLKNTPCERAQKRLFFWGWGACLWPLFFSQLRRISVGVLWFGAQISKI